MEEEVWIQILGREVKGGGEQKGFKTFYLVLFSFSCYFSNLPIHPCILCSRNYPPRSLRLN